MPNKINPHPSILNALDSEHHSATPFSVIPGFIKKLSISAENKQQLSNLLQVVSEKEITHLNDKLAESSAAEGINMQVYNWIREIEGGTDDKQRLVAPRLIVLAKNILVGEFGSPVSDILKKIEATLGSGAIEAAAFDNPHKDLSAQFEPEQKTRIQQEQQVRVIMNALIMGAGHRIFDHLAVNQDRAKKNEYEKVLNGIDPNLFQSYYDLVYNNLKHMRESNPSQGGPGTNTGLVQLVSRKIESTKEIEGKYETKIDVKADIFPVLLHEMAKGVMEYIAYTRYNGMETAEVQSILSVDSRHSEHWMMLIGPQIYKQLFFLIKEALAQYNENNFFIEKKEASDYIVPITYQIMQLPAEDFLFFIEQMLNPQTDGKKSIEFIYTLIKKIHTQYEKYISSITRQTPKLQLSIEEIAEQLAREFSFSSHEQNFIEDTLPRAKKIIEAAGYEISDKMLGRKIGNFVSFYVKRYSPSNLGDSQETWLTELEDAISQWASTKQELAAYGKLREEQKRHAFKTKDRVTKETKYVKPRFTLQNLEEARQKLSNKTRKEIEDYINGTIKSSGIKEWLQEHDEMNSQKSILMEELITLDEVSPQCIEEFGKNRGLYELKTEEQLKREASMMGGSCVDGYAKNVANEEMRIFSLRKGTQSHRTIGYTPSNCTITQVKGYTNRKKNSILEKDEVDFVRVMQALQFLCDTYEVGEIKDIDKDFFEGSLMKISSERIISPIKFKENDAVREQYFNITVDEKGQTTQHVGRDENSASYIITNTTVVPVTERFALNIYVNGELEKYYPKKIIAKFHNAYNILIKGEDGRYKAAGVVSSDLAHPPQFGVGGLQPHEALIKINGRYGVICRQSDNTYKEVLPCQYDQPIIFSSKLFYPKDDLPNQTTVKRKDKYGILQRNPDNSFEEIVPCIYEEELEFTWCNYGTVIKKDGKKGLLIRNKQGEWKEALPCDRYTEIKSPKPNGLSTGSFSHRESVVEKDKRVGILLIYGKTDDGLPLYKEILPCEYTALWAFGGQGLPPHESRVQKGEADGRCIGILRRNPDNSYEEVLPCVYDMGIPNSFGADGLPKEEVWVKKGGATGGNYGVVRRMSDGSYKEIVACAHSEKFKFTPDGTAISDGEYKTVLIRRTPIGGIEEEIVSITNIGEYYADGTIIQNDFEQTKKEQTPFFPEFIFRKNAAGEYEKVTSVPAGVTKIKHRGRFGLEKNEYRIGSNGFKGIMREDNGEFKITLPCIYQALEEMGLWGVQPHEMRAVRDGQAGIVARVGEEFVEVLPCKYFSIEGFGENGLPENCARVITQEESERKYGLIRRSEDGSYLEIIAPSHHAPRSIESAKKHPRLLSHEYVLKKSKVRDHEDCVYGVLAYRGKGKFDKVLPCEYEIRGDEEVYAEKLHLPANERLVRNHEGYCIIRRASNGKRNKVVDKHFENIEPKGEEWGINRFLKENEFLVTYEDPDQVCNIIIRTADGSYKKAFSKDFMISLGSRDRRELSNVRLLNACTHIIDGKRTALTTDMEMALGGSIHDGSLRKVDLWKEKDDQTFEHVEDEKVLEDLMRKSRKVRESYLAIQCNINGQGQFGSLMPITTHDGKELWLSGAFNHRVEQIYEFVSLKENPFEVRNYSNEERERAINETYQQEIQDAWFLPIE